MFAKPLLNLLEKDLTDGMLPELTMVKSAMTMNLLLEKLKKLKLGVAF